MSTSINSIKPEGITIAFPDVCITPAPPAGAVPVPYPAIAKTAVARQTPPAQKTPVSGAAVSASGAVVMTSEIQQLRGRLSTAHQQLLNLPGSRPEQWQALLKDYAVTASALYRTLETQDQLQAESRKLTTLSSAAKARHDASMSSIKNVR